MDTDLHYWWTKQHKIRAKKTLFSEFADKYIPNKFYLDLILGKRWSNTSMRYLRKIATMI